MKALFKNDNGEFFTYHSYIEGKHEFVYGNSRSRIHHGNIVINDDVLNFVYLFFKLDERKNIFGRHCAIEIEKDLILVKSGDKIIFHSHDVNEEVLTDWFFFEDFKEACFSVMGVKYARK